MCIRDRLFVVDSAPSRPNRTCRKKPSATATTTRSSSSTVQYLAPDGNLTGNARILRSSRSHGGPVNNYQPRAPHPGRPAVKPQLHDVQATSCNTQLTPGEGMRIGQALGLRHADVGSRDRVIRIVPRTDNANGARAKTRSVHVIPVSTALIRLYSEYLHVEYGALDSDYVFVNLFGEPVGAPLRYQAVNALVGRLRYRTGIAFTPHTLRHCHATDLIRRGVPIEVVSKRLTHASVSTTSSAYVHLGAEDVRAELVRAGVWAHQGDFR